MKYNLRTDSGVLVAKFDNRIAGEVFTQRGAWKEKVFNTGPKTVFVFEEDRSLELGNAMKIFLWKDFYLERED